MSGEVVGWVERVIVVTLGQDFYIVEAKLLGDHHIGLHPIQKQPIGVDVGASVKKI